MNYPTESQIVFRVLYISSSTRSAMVTLWRRAPVSHCSLLICSFATYTDANKSAATSAIDGIRHHEIRGESEISLELLS